MPFSLLPKWKRDSAINQNSANLHNIGGQGSDAGIEPPSMVDRSVCY